MSTQDTVKTTVRLPADLHWQFQGERAKRRLSNEKAICEAFALWIANPPANRGRRPAPALEAGDPAYVRSLLDMLRGFERQVAQLHRNGKATRRGRRKTGSSTKQDPEKKT